MFCKNCGKDIAADAKFCPSCGTTVAGEAAQPVAPQPAKVEGEKATGMAILGFLIPIVGVIYYFVKRKENPEKYKPVLWASLGGFVFWLLFSNF